MKKLAVLMPTYNCAIYLKESIDSILNQTYSNFDFYIYDDCSTDDTQKLIESYTDDRIFYIKNHCCPIKVNKKRSQKDGFFK